MGELIKWLFIGFVATNALACIWAIDRPREPMTRSTAASVVLINAAIVAAVLTYWE